MSFVGNGGYTSFFNWVEKPAGMANFAGWFLMLVKKF